jgi:hypothetical protein
LSPIYDRPPTTDHVSSLDAASVPAAWKDVPRSALLFVLPVPADPPEAAFGAVEIDAQQHNIDLVVGQKVRLSTGALAAGWQIQWVGTADGVLWPMPTAPRVFFARCPGKQSAGLARLSTPPPAKPPLPEHIIVEHFGIQFNVINSAGAALPHCQPKLSPRLSFDPPRYRNPGVVREGHNGQGIALRVGETFVWQGLDACPYLDRREYRLWDWPDAALLGREAKASTEAPSKTPANSPAVGSPNDQTTEGNLALIRMITRGTESQIISSPGTDDEGRVKFVAVRKGIVEMHFRTSLTCDWVGKLLVEVR